MSIQLQPGVTNAYMDPDAGTLVVIDAQPKNDQFFICIATNEFGKDEGRFTLDVKGEIYLGDHILCNHCLCFKTVFA